MEPDRGAEGDPDWDRSDAILRGLDRRGIVPVVTLWGTPRWANGGRSPNWVPRSKLTFAGFARRAADRYPFVRNWLIWNEPNQRRWLRPTSARVYTQTLLNPAYDAIHRATRGAKVAGGVTAPRGAYRGISPVDFIRGMGGARAKLDAYAHNPYPLQRFETPSAGGCAHCETITLATIDRLLRHVHTAFGRKRIWLTEYGYQTNPPDRLLGVSPSLQAQYLAEAAERAYATPYVDMLIHYLYQDEPSTARWQSGLLTVAGRAKTSHRMAMLPLAHVSRTGVRTCSGARCARARAGSATCCSSTGTAAGARSAVSARRRRAASSRAPCGRARARSSGSGTRSTGRRARSSAWSTLGIPRSVRAAPLEESAEALLALLARPALRDPPCRLGAVRAIEDELLRVA